MTHRSGNYPGAVVGPHTVAFPSRAAISPQTQRSSVCVRVNTLPQAAITSERIFSLKGPAKFLLYILSTQRTIKKDLSPRLFSSMLAMPLSFFLQCHPQAVVSPETLHVQGPLHFAFWVVAMQAILETGSCTCSPCMPQRKP